MQVRERGGAEGSGSGSGIPQPPAGGRSGPARGPLPRLSGNPQGAYVSGRGLPPAPPLRPSSPAWAMRRRRAGRRAGGAGAPGAARGGQPLGSGSRRVWTRTLRSELGSSAASRLLCPAPAHTGSPLGERGLVSMATRLVRAGSWGPALKGPDHGRKGGCGRWQHHLQRCAPNRPDPQGEDVGT